MTDLGTSFYLSNILSIEFRFHRIFQESSFRIFHCYLLMSDDVIAVQGEGWEEKMCGIRLPFAKE